MKEGGNSFWNSKSKEINRDLRARPRQKKAINILDRYVRRGVIVCDAGCGSGFYSGYLLSKDCKVYCIDYSEKAIELTKEITEGKAEEYLVSNLLDDSLGLKFRNTFDLIFSDGVLEHFSYVEQKKLMGNFITMKKENGIIVTIVPNILTYWEPIRHICENIPGVWEKAFTMRGLISLVKQSGQEIIEKGGVQVLPFNYSPEFLARWIGSSIYVVSR